MTWEMLKQDTYDSGFSAGEEHGIAIGEERGRNEGISLGITQAKLETAKNALSMKLTLEQIASLTGLSVEVIQDLANKQIIKKTLGIKTGRYYIHKGRENQKAIRIYFDRQKRNAFDKQNL